MTAPDTRYRAHHPACLVCKGEREAMADCRFCIGTGSLRYVAWASSPWTEIIPNLWVGAHDYVADGKDVWGYADQVTPEQLAQAEFEVVVSLYQRDCDPPQGTEHHTMKVPDDTVFGLDRDEIIEVHRLSGIVARAVADQRKTLVRCQAGLNRSSLTAALAMIRMGYEPQRTIDMIREKRESFCLFNQRFVEVILAQTHNPQEKSA